MEPESYVVVGSEAATLADVMPEAPPQCPKCGRTVGTKFIALYEGTPADKLLVGYRCTQCNQNNQYLASYDPGSRSGPPRFPGRAALASVTDVADLGSKAMAGPDEALGQEEPPMGLRVTVEQVRRLWLEGVPILDADGRMLVHPDQVGLLDEDVEHDEDGVPLDSQWEVLAAEVNRLLPELSHNPFEYEDED